MIQRLARFPRIFTTVFPQPAWMRTTMRLLAAGLLLFLPTLLVSAVHDEGVFELGDGSDNPGTADIQDDPGSLQPDWAGIFEFILTDPQTGAGEVEVADLHGGLAAIFMADHLAVKGNNDRTTFASANKNSEPQLA